MGHIRFIQASFLAVLLLAQAGCAQDQAKYRHPVPPLNPTVRAGLDSLALEVPASVSDGQTVPGVPLVPEVTAGQAFGAAAIGGLPVLALPAGCLGEPFCTVAMGAVGVATYILIVPAMAIGALASAPPDSHEVTQARDVLGRTLTGTDWTAILRREVEEKLRAANVALASDAAARLTLTLEGPWLVTQEFDAVPTLTIHDEFLKDGDCLIDRHWRWNGDRDDFVDFADDNGAPYRKALEQGLKQLATAIVEDLFSSTKPRQTAYATEAAFKNGAAPRAAAAPMAYQDTIIAWDKTEQDAKAEPRCGGLH